MDQGISTKPISSLGIRRESSPSSIPWPRGWAIAGFSVMSSKV